MRKLIVIVLIILIFVSFKIEAQNVLVVADSHWQYFSNKSLEIGHIVSYLNDMGITPTQIDEPSNGLTSSDIQGYDIVIFSTAGVQRNQWKVNTVNTLIDYLENQGGMLYICGDDMTYTNGVLNVPTLIHLNYQDNGSSDTIVITNPTHPVMSGPYGTVTNFYHQKDIDRATRTNTGEVELAKRNSTNTTAILAYESPSGGRLVVSIPHIYASHDIVVYNETNRAKVEKMFKNAIAWFISAIPTPTPTVSPTPTNTPTPAPLPLFNSYSFIILILTLTFVIFINILKVKP